MWWTRRVTGRCSSPTISTPRYAENLRPVRLQGLDPDRQYLVEEINLRSGTRGLNTTLSGDYLMKVGLQVLRADEGTSRVFRLTAR